MFDRTTKLHLRPRYRKDAKSKKTLIGYYVEAYDPTRKPARKWIPLGTKDKTGAMTRLAAIDAAIGRGEFDPWTDRLPEEGVTFDTAAERYLEARAKRSSSVRNDKSILDALGATLPLMIGVAHVTRKHVETYLGGLTLKDSSKITYLARLRAFFNWAVSEALVRTNPTVGIDVPKLRRRAPRYLQRSEYDALLAEIDKDIVAKRSGTTGYSGPKLGTMTGLRDLIVVAVHSGLRIDELCHLRRSAYNPETRMVTVVNDDIFDSKNGHDRVVPLPDEAAEIVERRLGEYEKTDPSDFVFRGVRGRKLSATTASKRFRFYADRAGLHDITFHGTRRTYASWLVIAGVPIYDVKNLLGHQKVETTAASYASLSKDSLRAAVDQGFTKRISRRVVRARRRRPEA